MKDVGLIKRISNQWAGSTLKMKISFFLSSVLLIVLVSVLLDLWIAKLSVIDLNSILNSNVETNDLVSAIANERDVFENYMRGEPDSELLDDLDAAFMQTQRAVSNLPYSYDKIGPERYSKTFSINNMYEVYCGYRDEILHADRERENYVRDLYRVYDIQAYLYQYANELMNMTIEDGTVSYKAALPKLLSIPVVVTIVTVLLLVAIYSVSRAMNRSIVDPIISLAKAAEKIAQRDFTAEDVKIDNRDEIGELASTFNDMKYATAQYIVTLKKNSETMELLHTEEMERLNAEKQLERMRFDVLKNQINPHFLFNTLNVISGMAQLEDAHTTEQMIRSLSDLFRYNLKTGDSEVVLSQEIKVVADYMYLQKMRFGDRIGYEIDCRVDEKTVMIPAFTLQPIVENAIIHGISSKESGGEIKILIEQDGNYLKLTVSDNGIGMTEEELQRLLEDIDITDGKYHGIGLGNTARRIRGMYNDGEVTISSKKGEGTTVNIRVPMMDIGTVLSKKEMEESSNDKGADSR